MLSLSHGLEFGNKFLFYLKNREEVTVQYFSLRTALQFKKHKAIMLTTKLGVWKKVLHSYLKQKGCTAKEYRNGIYMLAKPSGLWPHEFLLPWVPFSSHIKITEPCVCCSGWTVNLGCCVLPAPITHHLPMYLCKILARQIKWTKKCDLPKVLFQPSQLGGFPRTFIFSNVSIVRA